MAALDFGRELHKTFYTTNVAVFLPNCRCKSIETELRCLGLKCGPGQKSANQAVHLLEQRRRGGKHSCKWRSCLIQKWRDYKLGSFAQYLSLRTSIFSLVTACMMSYVCRHCHYNTGTITLLYRTPNQSINQSIKAFVAPLGHRPRI